MLANFFISYSRKDQATVHRIVDVIKDHGFAFFLDINDIDPGDVFVDHIVRALEDCSHFAILITPNSVASTWVNKELNIAISRQLRDSRFRIIPLKFGHAAEIPGKISELQYLDISDSLDALRHYISSIASIEPCKSPSSALPNIGGLQAVVFLHLSSFNDFEPPFSFATDAKVRDSLVEKYKNAFATYLRCNANEKLISVLYVYVDWGLRRAPLTAWRASHGRDIDVGFRLIAAEKLFRDLLEEAFSIARRENCIGTDKEPVFVLVMLTDMLNLISEFARIDERLLGHLAGKEEDGIHRFTYDSPKFLEAVIRIARGTTPHLSWNPVVRIDEDVSPNADAIKTLLFTYANIDRSAPFYFFSGRYGCMTSGAIDFLNDFSVRTHWISDPDGETDQRYLPNNGSIRKFLADLGELGATQLLQRHSDYSSNMTAHINSGRPYAKERLAPAVVSGAGLIMSLRAIEFLPPFMNFPRNAVWVDDHLKRRLHEALNDMGVGDVECVESARFQQERYRQGIWKKDLDWAEKKYLARLTRGCVLRRLISEIDDTPTEYAKTIKSVVEHTHTRLEGSLARDLEKLRLGMLQQARERANEVLSSWTSEEFQLYRHYKWAKEFSARIEADICVSVVDNALEYISVVRDWPIMTRTIKRLQYAGNMWLFREGSH